MFGPYDCDGSWGAEVSDLRVVLGLDLHKGQTAFVTW